MSHLVVLAVLSGVIGGASWDFVKYISHKIASQIKDDSISELVSDDEKLKQFGDYMLDYHHSFRDVTSDIQDVIFEEMRAHAAADTNIPLTLDFEDKAALLKVLKKYAITAGEKHRQSKLSVSFVRGLWEKTKISIDYECNSTDIKHDT